MLVGCSLKKFVILGTSALSLGLTAFPAIAKDPATSCIYKSEIPVQQVDENTIICRDLNPKSSANTQINDQLTLYRYCGEGTRRAKNMVGIVSIEFFRYDLKGVIMSDFGKCNQGTTTKERTTGFLLNERKFDRWFTNFKAEPDLLDLYRSDVTMLLNAAENSPVEKPTF